jgi:hypothetical protein
VNNSLIDNHTDIHTVYQDPYSVGGGLNKGGGWEKGLTAGAADTLKTAATMAGELVAGIRITVRDAIAALVGYLVDLVVEEACTVVLATPVVVAQGVEEISRVSIRIGESLTKLGKAISELAGWLVALRDMLDGVYAELSALAESRHAEAES